jgi:Tfp pilus assembly protein PilF
MSVRSLVLALFVVVASAPLAWAEQRGQAKEQVEFGIQVAQRGLWKEAREAYEKALKLEPNNSLVRQNYDLFKEINDRAAQKDGRQH